MEGSLMRKQICEKNRAPSSSVSMQKKSQSSISKMKSKVRIIHIYAPEIIKTDAANFRDLVQRLTGKPRRDEQMMIKREKRGHGAHAPAEEEEEKGFTITERVKKEEEEIWRDANTGGGFLGGFSEFDHFPFMEGKSNVYEE